MNSVDAPAPFVRMFRVAMAAVCASLMVACSGQVDLMSAATEDEANEVVSVLLESDIKVRKIPGKDGMVGVRVNGEQVGRALQLLRENGLPREPYVGMGQLFKKEGLISSPLEERARYIYALTQELSSTLSRIDGVLRARVHVVLPERGTSGEPPTSSTAAVFIKYKEGYDLERIQPQVRRLVSNSIPGLTPEHVSIVLIASEPPPRPKSAPALATPPATDERLAMLLWGAIPLALLTSVALFYVVWRYVIPRHRRTAPRDVAA